MSGTGFTHLQPTNSNMMQSINLVNNSFNNGSNNTSYTSNSGSGTFITNNNNGSILDRIQEGQAQLLNQYSSLPASFGPAGLQGQAIILLGNRAVPEIQAHVSQPSTEASQQLYQQQRTDLPEKRNK